MKKRLGILLAVILAATAALSVLVFVGCGGVEYKVTIQPASVSISTGDTRQLTAKIDKDDDVEFEWSSSDESVATVDASGVVFGSGAGNAVITATVKGTDSKAECQVKVKEKVEVTFKADGEAVTAITLDIADETKHSVQLTATSSDGSNITRWMSGDEQIASVSSSGLVTVGVKEGSTTITAYTANNDKGTITVTTVDSVEGEHYSLDTTPREGWYYTMREDGGRSLKVNEANFRLETVTVDVSGDWNWTPDSFYLVKQDSTVAVGWHELTMNIKSNITTYITINDTRVPLVSGDNEVSVAYEQVAGQPAINITFSNGTMAAAPNVFKMEIGNVTVKEWTEKALVLPSFSIEGDTITFDDKSNSKNGVDHYEMGLFTEGIEEPVFTQRFNTTTELAQSGTINTSGMDGSANNKTYIVKVRAIGFPGYASTDWTTDTASYEVTNADQPYDLTIGSDPQMKGGGPSEAMTSGRWEYTITDIAEGASFQSARYENGTVTWTGCKGWASDSLQMFRHYAQYEAGTALNLKMKINLDITEPTVTGGVVLICGQEVMLNEGDNTIDLTIEQSSGAPTIEIIFGKADPDNTEWPGKAMSADSLQYCNLTVKISEVSVTRAA